MLSEVDAFDALVEALEADVEALLSDVAAADAEDSACEFQYFECLLYAGSVEGIGSPFRVPFAHASESSALSPTEAAEAAAAVAESLALFL